MFSVKVILAVLFPALLSGSILKAQKPFDPEVVCNDFCRNDSLLFFQEVEPRVHLNENEVDNTNLKGPYFDLFPGLKTDIQSALYFFPELSAVHIKFSYKPINQTMNSRPTFLNIFRQKAKRHYRIIINNNKGKCKGLPFEELSFNIKTGWLGHELAHICDYENMNSGQTFWFAFKYVFSKKYVRSVERNTDLITIRHGLAFPLYDGTDYLLRSKDIGAKYRNYTIVNGLSLREIKCFWYKLQNGLSLGPLDNHVLR